MQTAKSINGYLNNVSRYVEEIEKSVNEQLEIDFNQDVELSNPDSMRFKALNIMLADCTWINSLLKGIHTNLLFILNQEKVKV